MSDLHLPFLASIPYNIQIDDLIPDSVKIFYGQLTGLSVKCGYLWATDEQLAQMKNTSERNIQRWFKILEDAGYIKRETQNTPKKNDSGGWEWEKKRKVFINHGFERKQVSNNSYETAKIDASLEPDKNGGSLEPDKNGDININLLESISKQTPDCDSFSYFENLDIEDKLKIRVTNEHNLEEIKLAVKRCKEWKSRPSDTIGLMTALKKADSWIDNISSEQQEKNNTTYLNSLKHLDGKIIALNNIIIGNKYVEFTCGMKSRVFNVDDKEFRKSVVEYLEKLTRWETENN